MNIEINNEDIMAFLQGITDEITEVEENLGESLQLLLMEHLAAKQADPESHRTARSLGAQSSGLYADFARSLSNTTSEDHINLYINHAAAAQRFHGGTIEPVNKTYLTIPVSAESYGKSVGAGDFSEELEFLYDDQKKPWAISKADEDHILFLLVKSVTQKPDPTIIPADADFISHITKTILEALDSLEEN